MNRRGYQGKSLAERLIDSLLEAWRISRWAFVALVFVLAVWHLALSLIGCNPDPLFWVPGMLGAVGVRART